MKTLAGSRKKIIYFFFSSFECHPRARTLYDTIFVKRECLFQTAVYAENEFPAKTIETFRVTRESFGDYGITPCY